MGSDQCYKISELAFAYLRFHWKIECRRLQKSWVISCDPFGLINILLVFLDWKTWESFESFAVWGSVRLSSKSPRKAVLSDLGSQKTFRASSVNLLNLFTGEFLSLCVNLVDEPKPKGSATSASIHNWKQSAPWRTSINASTVNDFDGRTNRIHFHRLEHFGNPNWNLRSSPDHNWL